MSDITLKNGRVIKVDVSEVTRADWLAFIDASGTKESEDLFVYKCTGLSVEELDALPIVEYKRIIRTIVSTVQAPDPS